MATEGEAMSRLGDVLQMLAELTPGDRTRAFEEALAFYNERNPHCRIEPAEGYETSLVSIDSPIIAALRKLGVHHA